MRFARDANQSTKTHRHRKAIAAIQHPAHMRLQRSPSQLCDGAGGFQWWLEAWGVASYATMNNSESIGRTTGSQTSGWFVQPRCATSRLNDTEFWDKFGTTMGQIYS